MNDYPTDPTWGICLNHHGNYLPPILVARFFRTRYEEPFLGNEYGLASSRNVTIPLSQVDGFVPLTDEQIALLEGRMA